MTIKNSDVLNMNNEIYIDKNIKALKLLAQIILSSVDINGIREQIDYNKKTLELHRLYEPGDTEMISQFLTLWIKDNNIILTESQFADIMICIIAIMQSIHDTSIFTKNFIIPELNKRLTEGHL